MKEQIVIYYNKDKKHPNDYIIKRVLTPDGDNYSITSYYKVFGMTKRYKSKIELSAQDLAKYVLQCMKSPFFNRVEYQNIMEGI